MRLTFRARETGRITRSRYFRIIARHGRLIERFGNGRSKGKLLSRRADTRATREIDVYSKETKFERFERKKTLPVLTSPFRRAREPRACSNASRPIDIRPCPPRGVSIRSFRAIGGAARLTRGITACRRRCYQFLSVVSLVCFCMLHACLAYASSVIALRSRLCMRLPSPPSENVQNKRRDGRARPFARRRAASGARIPRTVRAVPSTSVSSVETRERGARSKRRAGTSRPAACCEARGVDVGRHLVLPPEHFDAGRSSAVKRARRKERVAPEKERAAARNRTRDSDRA